MKFIFSTVFLILLSVNGLFAYVTSIPNTAVGAPLDGGLLAILAAAGISYFAARKKKRQVE